ADTEMEEVD
nr:Chain B, ATP-dependent molecular chaperone HSP82 [Saccharomyces cerevisiae S288C]